MRRLKAIRSGMSGSNVNFVNLTIPVDPRQVIASDDPGSLLETIYLLTRTQFIPTTLLLLTKIEDTYQTLFMSLRRLCTPQIKRGTRLTTCRYHDLPKAPTETSVSASSRLKPRCRILTNPISHKKPSATSSTYTTDQRRSESAVLSLSRGFHVSKNTFSPISSFVPPVTSSHGRRHSPILRTAAYHTHTLTLSCTEVITTEDAEPGGWIPTFSRVLRLELNDRTNFGNVVLEVALAPFHKFSPVLKSLRVDSAILSCSQTFNLVRSFPLLEDLALVGHNGWEGDGNDLHEQRTVVTSTSGPVFTGTLELLLGGFGSTARRLLDLPGGLRFRKLVLLWHCVRDFRWIMELVVRCSDTLESLNIMRHPPRKFVLVLLWSYDLPSFTGDLSHASIDLSKATKLKDVIFRPGSPTISWIIMTLQPIPSKHRDLRQISIHVPHDFALINVGANIGQIIGEAVYREC